MRIVLASGNDKKLAELRALLAPLNISLGSQADFGVPGAEENAATFVENALIKARSVSLATGMPALADDSGLVVPALDGAPGVRSARYAGEPADDAANNAKLIRSLQGIESREAYFYCAMVMMLRADDPTPVIATAAWHGSIVDRPRGSRGFGYDPHFLVAGMDLTAAELAPERKNRLSHRGQAAAALITQLGSAY